MNIQRLTVSAFQSNCYIVGNEETKEAIVIDPGDEGDRILAALQDAGLTTKLIVATHAHLDHVMAVSAVQAATGAPFLMHPGDADALDYLPDIAQRMLGVDIPPAPPVDRWLAEGDSVEIDGIQLKVLFTPGHSPGSVSLLYAPPGERSVVFSGDALFAGSIGRTDLPGGDFNTLARSIREKLFTLPDNTLVLSGHGGPTTIGQERRTNPFVGEEIRD
jgi:hydroxyacylglutathione hydrolase